MRKQQIEYTALLCVAVAMFLGGLLFASPVQADFHLVKITEVMAGANGNANIQFVEIEMTSQGENCPGTGNHPTPGDTSTATCDASGPGARLLFSNADESVTTQFIFPGNLPNFQSGRKFLIGTQAFDDLSTTFAPDFIMPALVVPTSGKVCYKNVPGAPFVPILTCLSYGNFTGNTEGVGPPAAALPTTGCSSLRRVVADSFNNSIAFSLGTPDPVNNADVDGTVCNRAPVADAGSDQNVTEGDTVNLNGTASSDPDGDSFTFAWTQIAGPNVTLNNANTSTPDFIAPAVGPGGATLTFRLTVTDVPVGASSTDDVDIQVANVNQAPVANPQTVFTNKNPPIDITLTGSDPESSPLTFSIDTVPPNGGLSGTPPNVTYTPNLNFAGPDSFTFKVNDGAQDSAPATVSITVASVGHFLCYRAAAAKAASGQPPFTTFVPQVVTLEDQFETKLTNVGKLTGLCNPADKNNEGVIDPNTHLTAFGIKDGKTDPPQPKLVGTQHTVVNQFGTLVVSVTKINRLLVPSSKSLGETPPLPLGSNTVDHFKCYGIKVAKAPSGQPPFPTFTPLNVTLEDQFGLRVFTATKPSLLCNPVDKNGEGIQRPADHLMCYQFKLASTMPPQPGFTPTRVSATNQFGSGVLDATATESLCVPSQKDPP